MGCSLVKVNIETDDVPCTPSVTCPMVGVQCPIFDTLLQHDMGITLLQGEVHILVTKGESGQYITVTTDDNTDGTVWTVVGDSQWIVLVHVGFEIEFIKTLLQAFMKWHGI